MFDVYSGYTRSKLEYFMVNLQFSFFSRDERFLSSRKKLFANRRGGDPIKCWKRRRGLNLETWEKVKTNREFCFTPSCLSFSRVRRISRWFSVIKSLLYSAYFISNKSKYIFRNIFPSNGSSPKKSSHCWLDNKAKANPTVIAPQLVPETFPFYWKC